mgnify:CR=1 FL=1
MGHALDRLTLYYSKTFYHSRLWLSVFGDNEHAIVFYAKHGWREVMRHGVRDISMESSRKDYRRVPDAIAERWMLEMVWRPE